MGAALRGGGARVIQACDAIAKELDAFLGGICRREFPLIVLQAASRPRFLQCLGVLAGAVEGETRTDSAVCLMTPMPAVLLPSYVDPTLRGTLAHELLYASVQHLDIPVWLNEGLAQIVQERFQAHAVHQMTHEEKRHNVVHWRAAGTLGLWRGDAFFSLDEDCAFAYEASYAIVSNLIVDHGAKAAGRFVRAAGGADDYGEAAARDVLGVSLSDLAASFLGPGDWSPGGDGFDEGGAGGRWTLDGWVAD